MKFTTPFISDCDISVKKELYSHSSHPSGMSYTSEKSQKEKMIKTKNIWILNKSIIKKIKNKTYFQTYPDIEARVSSHYPQKKL
jgi:hypothetical protein